MTIGLKNLQFILYLFETNQKYIYTAKQFFNLQIIYYKSKVKV